MKLWSQIALVARLETRFYLHQPKLVLAALAVALIPAIYVLIYLASVWDPAAHTGALPVALVNLDRDVHYRDQVFNLGREVTAKLKSGHQFGYAELADEQEARRMVREGRYAFALIIPANFSSNALPAADRGAGRLTVYTSEGNSYQSANLARRFAEDLGQEINVRLNERRWALVLSTAVGSQRSVERLNDAVAQLSKGAHELAGGSGQAFDGAKDLGAGAGRLDLGVARLGTGVKELGTAIRTLDEKQPEPSELQRLKAGAESLVAGHQELGQGLAELRTGSGKLKSGVVAFRDEAKSSLMLGGRILDGAEEMADGIGKLDSGLQAAAAAQRKLADGAARVGEGVGALASGMQSQGAALEALASRLPADRQIDELTAGTGKLAAGAEVLAEGNRKLRDGARHLQLGIDLLADELPDSVSGVEGSAEGLANSVRPEVEVEAAVENNGSAYAPNIIPAALWLGAGIAAFLIHVRVLPSEARGFSRIAQLLGKIAVPSALVLLQALLVLISVLLVLHMQVAALAAFAATLAVSALTFLVIVIALTRAFGDAGKALSILFLAVQLSSSGGILPVELSGGLFMDISPWLPLTWVVKAMKASLFGAFDLGWLVPLMWVSVAGLLATVAACLVGNWRYVEQAAIRPTVDF